MKAETTARLPYANAIHFWLEHHEEERKAHLGDARKQRFDAILVRLRHSDWKKELEFLGDEGVEALANLPLIRLSTKLTEGSWKKVLTALDGFLNETREKRLDKELRAALIARFELLEQAIQAHYVTLPRTAKMDCRPRYIDFAFTPECRAIVDVPTSETVTLDQFTAVIPALAEKWDTDRHKKLLEYLRPHLGEVAPDVDPLSLAIAVFKLKKEKSCYVDIGRMRYPTIFTHDCHFNDCFRGAILQNAEVFHQGDTYTRTVHSLKWGEFEFGRLGEKPNYAVFVDAPFHLDELADPSKAACAMQCMRRLVSALGLDPARATFDDLDRSDVWLRCVTCETARPSATIWAMPWTRAYRHDESHRTGDVESATPRWRRVDDEDMERVRVLRLIPPEPETGLYDTSLWSCSLCPAFDAKRTIMAKHLEESHDIADIMQADKDGVIYLHPTMSTSGRRYREMVRLRERDLLTRFSPEAIQQLKTLQVEVEEVGDVAMDWYPSPDALRVAANLPALEHLLVETNTGPHLDFTGFHSLLTLQIIDCGRGDDTTWLLARCSSPHLRELTIDFTNLYDCFNWGDVHTLCSTIAQSAPQLRCLDFTPGILDLPEAPDNSEHAADILLTVVHPLFALRQLTVLTICFDLSEISLSDAVLEVFAKAWPMLVRLTICFIKILHIDPDSPHLYPANITLRSLDTFSERCPQLQGLHIPHIYVPPRMDCDTAGGGEQLQGRCLKELVICRAAIGNVQSQVTHLILAVAQRPMSELRER
ncbi:hypothetical protein VTO73DRAFT_7758 [Trametes versicolor]